MNLYQILNVDKTATLDEIKRSYKDLAKQFHPDINPYGEERFREIAKAYSILSDQDKRTKYDNPNIKWFDMLNFSSIITTQMAFIRSSDASLNQLLTFEEAYFGCIKIINYKRIVGNETKEETITVNFPQVKTSNVITIPNMGNTDGDIPGTLSITIDVDESEFKIKGQDIIWEKKINFIHFLYANILQLDFLGKTLKIELKDRTEAGHLITINGLGFKSLSNFRRVGNLYIKLIPDFSVEIPEKLIKELQGIK
jgi:DnaJ-class molecular chaperone